MSNELISKTDPEESKVYQIRIKGHLGAQCTDWLGDLAPWATIALKGRM